MSEEIKRQLRESAQAYQPDRARMLARAERALAGPVVRHRTRSFTRSGPRTVLAALATAALLATGGFAVADIVRGPAPTTVVTTPAATPSTTPRPTPSVTATDPTPTTATGGTHPVQPAAARPQAGPLWSAGSVDPHSTVYWSQADVLLRTAQPLTTLTVEIRVTQTGGVRSTGNWSTLATGDFTVAVQQSGNALVYRWTLRPGRTLPTGQYEFAAQFNHATGVRDAGGDRYRVDARPQADSSTAVWGGFTPPR